jgi:beta-N-acetylhexosaminidase
MNLIANIVPSLNGPPFHDPCTPPSSLTSLAPRLTAADRQRLAHPLVGGVILFARNWQDRAQLLQLCQQHQGRARGPADLRGPRRRARAALSRPMASPTCRPCARLGEMWMQDGKAARWQARCGPPTPPRPAGYVLGAELRACGVDLSFTPVLDLDWGESGVIGDRAFHRDPRVVACWPRA